MFCKNCGQPMDDMAAVCVHCGVQKGMGYNYCQNCGAPVAPNAAVCTNCGAAVYQQPTAPYGQSQKSKLAAGLLAIFLGYLGIHNFYLGYTSRAVTQLLLSLLLSWTVVVPIGIWIWTIVETVKIFQGQIPDANGCPLADS